jgi:hypothetical protein
MAVMPHHDCMLVVQARPEESGFVSSLKELDLPEPGPDVAQHAKVQATEVSCHRPPTTLERYVSAFLLYFCDLADAIL